ncbi:MAG: hypothetical protein M1820_006404 [Bogoriella megaspora]|nr:MAG: hypothetical protein M1820_006404 [Bogoriella megaspora]
MRLSQFSLLLTTALGLTQVVAFPSSRGESKEVEHHDASAQLSRLMVRSPQCSLKEPGKCTACGKIELRKGSEKQSCKGQECKSEETAENIEKRAQRSVPFDDADGEPWGPGDNFGTTNLGGCTFLAIYDEHYVAGAHIPPMRILVNEYNQQVGHQMGAQVIWELLTKLNRVVGNIRGIRHAYLLVPYGLNQDEHQMMVTWLRQAGAYINEQWYDPDWRRTPHRGIFALSRRNGIWPPSAHGPV